MLALLHEYLHVLYCFCPLRYSVWIWLAVYLLRPCLVGLCFVHSPIFQPFQQQIGKVRDQLFLCKILTRLLCCIQFRGLRKQPFGGLRCCVLLYRLAEPWWMRQNGLLIFDEPKHWGVHWVQIHHSAKWSVSLWPFITLLRNTHLRPTILLME